MMSERQPILVVGVSDGGAASLPEAVQARVLAATLLVGGARQLQCFPAFNGETMLVGASVDAALARLRLAWEQGERAVVLASGDPLWYGIGASLRRVLPPEALEIMPAPTSFQLAFAAIGEPWHDAALLSAHARPLADVVARARVAPKAAILTDNQHTPQVVARALLDAGLARETPCAVCENLGGPAQRIVRTTLAEASEQSFAPLNVFVVWGGKRKAGREDADLDSYSSPHRLIASSPHPPGLPDDAFATEAGQITKREIRLLSLAELALAAGEVLWDIGAGSGAIGIEAARAQPAARVFAVERRGVFIAHARENLRRFPAPNLALVEGEAPHTCEVWPDPHAVFIGGSGGRLAELVALARKRLQIGGRLVVHLVTLEHLAELRALLPDAQVVQIQVNRGVPIQTMLRFEALNPVFVVVWRKAT